MCYYRYELVNNYQQLGNPKLLLNLPALYGCDGPGGKVVIGPDNNVCLLLVVFKTHRTQPENIVLNGPPADSTGGITQEFTQDGTTRYQTLHFGQTTAPMEFSVCAYEIRNSFGIGF